MKFEFLGTSDTGGIPLHMCSCSICEEARKKGTINRSTSAYLELEDGSVILFDAGIDDACNRFNTTPIRAVFLTHFHADHCLGLIRLRKSAQNITCYTPKDDAGFGDLFRHPDSILYQPLEPFACIEVNPHVRVVAIPLEHSKPTYGYVLFTPQKTCAYLTDCASIPEDSLAYLKAQKLDYVFIDAAYTPWYPSKKHLNWESAEAYIEVMAPKEGYLIHASCKTLEPLKQSNLSLKYDYIDKGFCVEM